MWFQLLVILCKALFFITCILGLTSFLTWQERKQSAVMQDRLGANRAPIFGIRAFGLFHIFADALKMFFKEDYVPPGGDRLLHTIAPFTALFFALMSFAAIPFGDAITVSGQRIELQIFPLNVGVLFILAMMSMGIYGTFLAGFSSNNKYAFLGGLRASSQMISYEITMGATLVGLLMIFGTLDLAQLNRAQGGLLWGWLPMWGIFLQPLGFLLFFAAGCAEINRSPFDLMEADSELVAGFHTEYSSMRFALIQMAEYINMITVCVLATNLFLGGWQSGIPGVPSTGFLGFTWWGLKVASLLFVFVWLRGTLPRFRYDQLMRFGWKVLIPVAAVWILITATGVAIASR